MEIGCLQDQSGNYSNMLSYWSNISGFSSVILPPKIWVWAMFLTTSVACSASGGEVAKVYKQHQVSRVGSFSFLETDIVLSRHTTSELSIKDSSAWTHVHISNVNSLHLQKTIYYSKKEVSVHPELKSFLENVNNNLSEMRGQTLDVTTDFRIFFGDCSTDKVVSSFNAAVGYEEYSAPKHDGFSFFSLNAAEIEGLKIQHSNFAPTYEFWLKIAVSGAACSIERARVIDKRAYP